MKYRIRIQDSFDIDLNFKLTNIKENIYTVSLNILYFNEKLRNKGKLYDINSIIKIYSYDYPELYIDDYELGIYLNGEEEKRDTNYIRNNFFILPVDIDRIEKALRSFIFIKYSKLKML